MSALTDEIDLFLQLGRAEGWSKQTVDAYRRRLDALAEFLKQRGVVRVADVMNSDLDAYMIHLVERDLKRSSRQTYGASIREFFRRMQERGKVLRNPARDLPMPDDDDVELPKAPLDEAEVIELFASLPRSTAIELRTILHLELLYSCALRLGESVALDLVHVDLHRRVVHVVAGKGGKDRVVPMMGGVVAALTSYLAVRRTLLRGPDHGALLIDQYGKRLDGQAIQQVLRRLSQRRGADKTSLHPHLFRHSIAVHLLRGGADIRHVQAFLGHASLETTKIYLRLVPGRLKEDYDAAMPMIDVGQITSVEP